MFTNTKTLVALVLLGSAAQAQTLWNRSIRNVRVEPSPSVPGFFDIVVDWSVAASDSAPSPLDMATDVTLFVNGLPIDQDSDFPLKQNAINCSTSVSCPSAPCGGWFHNGIGAAGTCRKLWDPYWTFFECACTLDTGAVVGDFGIALVEGDVVHVTLSAGAGGVLEFDTSDDEMTVLVPGAPNGTSFCTGDDQDPLFPAGCPCGNTGAVGRGCANSASPLGARLSAGGATSPDSIVFSSTGELPSALTILLQGDATAGVGVSFGDGKRCAGGHLKRLYVRNASGGNLLVPGALDLPVSAQSAALGDAIPAGATRYYQAYYRDANASFCPAPAGNTWNVTNGVSLAW